ncbi:uncharacterized protein TrAtP1_011145 [Trichoderma atroviride]|uniref:Uncharacterized protein n=1 Tax=Hypocrea atroviridis (strain ATCC 20476 / IMI 206040) TaxID=452589 RepID=G9NFA5_HYPAI|nr:uncharacterized protein TRIATDRAFT_303557 [Trichoderma atroviride IMI 206040]EHK50621.1 hypothetical protein TRIATDRAFT_303557 [Trichoderma atroviride IMI 206040]UKZ70147.1 hypothetical protein TrAtP1_011145 [Trichoderma atroviride]
MRRPGGQAASQQPIWRVAQSRPGQGWGVNELMPIIVFPAARRKGKKGTLIEREKGHHAVDASPLQPHLCDKDTARQVTAPVDPEPPEVLQVTGGLSGTIAARGSVLRFGSP